MSDEEYMTESARQLIAEFMPRGVVLAGRLQLPKDDALEFADRLKAIGVGIYGLELWYYHDKYPGQEIEYPWSPDYSRLKNDPEFVAKTIGAAKAYIEHEIPEYISLVGFVF